jgi:hypothetical protein
MIKKNVLIIAENISRVIGAIFMLLALFFTLWAYASIFLLTFFIMSYCAAVLLVA